MNISFKNPKEKEFYEDNKKLTKKYGPLRSRKIQQRIKNLRAADSVGELFEIFPRCHLLDHEYKGCFPLDLDGPYRLIIKLIHEDYTDFSNLNLYLIKNTQIMEVKNYHDK